jgi:Fe-S cluster assembly protein SufD
MEIVEKIKKITAFVDGFQQHLSNSALVSELALERAKVCLQEKDFPTSKDEFWKYTRTGKIANTKFSFANDLREVKNILDFIPTNFESYLAVFVNGIFNDSLSLLGNEIQVLSKISSIPEYTTEINSDEGENIFTAFNTLYKNNGVVVKILKDKKLSKPLVVLNISVGENIIFQPKNSLICENGSAADIVEIYTSLDSKNNFCNSAFEITLGENCNVDVTKVQLEEDTIFHIGSTFVSQAAGSSFTLNTYTLNGGLVRNNIEVSINGTNCETHLNGLYFINKNRHVDNHTLIDHRKPHSNSNELFKGILKDNATGVFNGKVFVRQEAQKTVAYQSNKNILLSDDATMNSKPELEIYADDVKCSHGSTTGQFDEEALFYLRARGIGEVLAKNMLVQAFANDVLNKIKHPPVRDFVEQKLIESFSKKIN